MYTNICNECAQKKMVSVRYKSVMYTGHLGITKKMNVISKSSLYLKTETKLTQKRKVRDFLKTDTYIVINIKSISCD